MKIANVVSINKLDLPEEYNQVQNLSEILPNLPTLIAGFQLVEKYYPNFNILNMELEPNIYWTFKRTEKRDKFEEDLEFFKGKVLDNLIKNVKYVFVDPIQQENKVLFKVIRKILNLKNVITFTCGEMIYMYSEGLIFGVDCNLMRYLSLNVDKIKNKVRKISSVFLDDYKILIEYKKNAGKFSNQVKYIPFLYSIKHE